MRTLLALLLALASPFTLAQSHVANAPTEIRPLLLGSTAPDAPLRTVEGKDTTLKQVLAGKPAVLVFYRGGWCPYCNLQLSELRHIKGELDTLGFQLIAASSDKPESIQKTLDKTPLDYTLVSDASTAASQAFGIAFKVDDETVAKYKTYGIDLEEASGAQHHALPVPGVFVIDAAGVVQFSYVHPDYRVRTPGKVILEAARAIKAGAHVLKPKF